MSTRMAVIVSGLMGREGQDRQHDFLKPNPVLSLSPLQSWRVVLGWSVRVFACVNQPLRAPLGLDLSGLLIFESASQFDRLLRCISWVEPDLDRPRHSHYLRLRPDSLLLGGPPQASRTPLTPCTCAGVHTAPSTSAHSFATRWSAARASSGVSVHSASTDRFYSRLSETAECPPTEYSYSDPPRFPPCSRRCAPSSAAVCSLSAVMAFAWSASTEFACRTSG